MTHKHTPAPWSAKWVMRDSSSGQYRVSHRPFLNSRAESVANSKLISAAPDLLEALEAMLEDFDGWSDEFILSIEKARAAIEKATQ